MLRLILIVLVFAGLPYFGSFSLGVAPFSVAYNLKYTNGYRHILTRETSGESVWSRILPDVSASAVCYKIVAGYHQDLGFRLWENR